MIRGFFLTLAIVVAGEGVRCRAAECGDTGNTIWTASTSQSLSGPRTLTLDVTNLYGSVSTVLYAWSSVSGSPPLASIDFSTVLSQPLAAVTKAGASLVIVAGADGYVYGRSASDLGAVWSRSTRRATCSADSLIATPQAQLWSRSSDAFRILNVDLIFAGTAYECGTTTANKVFGLNAANGNIAWTFNNTGAYQMDRVYGLAVDYARDTVYATSDKSDPNRAQNTLWALNSTNGTRRWAVDLGAIHTQPLLVSNSLYVANADGMLFKIDPVSGQVNWRVQVTCSASVILDLGFQISSNRLFVTDSSGTLHAVDDLGLCARRRWSLLPGDGSGFSTQAAVLESGSQVYAGTTAGRVWQINADTGDTTAYATVYALAITQQVLVQEPGVVPGEGARLFAASSTLIRKLCIPWPQTPGDKS